MTITDGTNTFSTDRESIEERHIVNANAEVTIGGKIQSQADAVRLQINSTLFLTAAEWILLQNILYNFDSELTYTPSRILLGKTSIVPMIVVAGQPSVQIRGTDGGETIFIIEIIFDEVIFT